MKTATRIRELISSRKQEFSPLEIRRELGLKNGIAITYVLSDMLQRGEIEHTGHGKYRFLRFSPERSGRSIIRSRIHRAIHVKRGNFRAKDIAAICDVNIHDARHELFKLFKSGDLDRVYLEQDGRVIREWVYMVKHPDRFYLKFCAKKASEISSGGKSDGSHRRKRQKEAQSQPQEG